MQDLCKSGEGSDGARGGRGQGTGAGEGGGAQPCKKHQLIILIKVLGSLLADEGTELTQITAFVGLLLAKQDTELRQNYSVMCGSRTGRKECVGSRRQCTTCCVEV